MSSSPQSSCVSPNGDASAPFTMDLRLHLQYTARRHVVTLFKEILAMFEQLGEEHDEAMTKMYDALPPEYKEYVNLADHFTEDKGERIRKAVLQRGNDCRRAIEEEIEKYEITFRQQ